MKFNRGQTYNFSSTYPSGGLSTSILPEKNLRDHLKNFLSENYLPEQRLLEYLKYRFDEKTFFIASSYDELKKELNLERNQSLKALNILQSMGVIRFYGNELIKIESLLK